ncbi:N-myristoyl transferase [Piedraia hortae CBS 480.64]|uniref:Glycylpeptide N-tetradecanoyltransferase n=1 Tax=Piedraia hortae CBS 480.64 TaxID=1314780 RepID=A0A6A7C7D0_9PEZI|nr:N-myristoyl transferase [Piedraia hortae CBS 480.64]
MQQPPKEGKAPEDYKFWNTQPVPKFKEPNLLQTTDGSNGAQSLPEGAILPDAVCKASIKPQPEKLVDGFEWCEVNLESSEEMQELYDLLYNHYVEDTDGSFRFNYSTRFLAWALKPPGGHSQWHIGVRTKPAVEGKKGKLVAFISGIPITLCVGTHTLKASEINFLCIHRKLRSKRLAPVLIKEITRRCYQLDIFQALYTAGTVLPTPVSTCRYYHRSLDWEHLYSMGFSHLPLGSTKTRQKYRYRVESHPQLKGLREMKPTDVSAVKDLLERYNKRFALRQEFTEDELTHLMCSAASKGVVWAYVVEQEGRITDFISYYLLESTVLRSQQKSAIRAAYLYYYASDAAFSDEAGANSSLQKRLQALVHDALILAKRDGFHVFNALTLLDNPLFLSEEKFEPGDGKLNYYLFNWRTAKLHGGTDENGNADESRQSGIGLVMV